MDMAYNKLTDLNNHLFEALERLNDDELMNGENGQKEIQRAKAIASIGQTIINNANTMLETVKVLDDYGYNGSTGEIPKLLGYTKD